MSAVVDQIRLRYPAYKDIPDEDLTVAIGKKYPVYLEQDDEFYQDFQRLTMSAEDKAQMAATEERADILAEQKKERRKGEYWEGVAERAGHLVGTATDLSSNPIGATIGRTVDMVLDATLNKDKPELQNLTEKAFAAPTIRPPKVGEDGVDYGPELGGQITAGAHDAVAELVATLSTPSMLLMLPAAANKAVLTAWISQMAGHQPERVMRATELFKQGNTKEAVKEVVTGIAELSMAEGGRRHVVSGNKPAPNSVETAARNAEANNAPATAEALKATQPKAEQPPEQPKGGEIIEEIKTQKEIPKEPEVLTEPATAAEQPPAAESINTGALGEKGMGGAKPGEFEPARQTATGIKNAAVDAERQARGQEPIMKAERVGNEVVWDRTMSRIDREPEWQDRLIDELRQNPRSATADEVVALDHRYVDLQNEYAKATRDGAQAYKDGYQIGIEEAKNRATFYESKLNELEQVVRKIGTEAGRAFQMRQRLMKEDFTLEAMEARARAAKGFEPLTQAEHTQIAELHRKLAEAEAKATEVERVSGERISMLEVQKALAEAKAISATTPAYEPRVLQAAEKFAKFMDRKGDEALMRLKERLARTSAGVDPTILSDVAIVGAAKLTRGVVDFAKWSDAMSKDLGEWFKEHAQEAWDASQKIFEENLSTFHKGVDKTTTERVRRAVTDIPNRINDAKESARQAAASGDGSKLHSEVRKLVRLLVTADPKITRDGLIDSVHAVLKESFPEMTRLEAMDAISGRGRFWTPDQAEVSKTIRDLSTQIRLVAHQIDVEAGKPLPRTGYQPEKMSDAARREQQKLNDLKRRYGVVVTDQAAQLGSILSARKTYYKNRISDLKAEIERRERIIKNRSESPTDPELTAIKSEYEQVRKEHEEIFGNRELTDEQRLKMATAAAKRNLESWEGRLKRAQEGDFSKGETRAPMSSAELDSIKARTESIKAEFDELKDLANPKKTPEEIALQSLKTRLAREKADLQSRIATSDFSPRRKVREFPLDKEAADAKAEVQLLRDEFNRQLEKHKYQQKSRAEKIWLGTKEGLNLSRAILTSWDVSAVFRQGGFIALGNPARAAKAMAPMFRALASEKKAAAVEAEIRSRPNARLYEQSKLFLAERETSRLTGMEEAFMSRFASKIPGVGASGRAYITFLNRLRADSFDALHAALIEGREATPAELSAIANYINVATGRGNLGKTAGAAEALSAVFFAPRLVASRFQLLAGEPLYRGSPRTRYLIAKEYAKYLTGLGVVLTLGMMAGADVESDPNSSDFGKMQFGNTRVDPMSGLSQATVLSSRIITGKKTTARGESRDLVGDKVKYGQRTIPDVLMQFLRSKLNPVVGSAIDARTGKNVVGEKVDAADVAQNMFTPLAMRDIYDVMIEQGIPKGTAISLLSLLGMSVQNYDDRKKNK